MVAKHAGDAAGGSVAVETGRRWQIDRRTVADAGVVVVENVGSRVVGILLSADARVAGAEVAGGIVGRLGVDFVDGNVAAPRSILAMARHDHPLFAQRMPAFFPAAEEVIVHR